ncbi:MAG: acetylglutamate kinase [Spirochaetes bacterium]|jgi:acetylglutamate kinase|nr:acetylglutamate kinase [Spirochaetota bacterium]
MNSPTIIVKIGGRTLSSPGVLEHLVADIAALEDSRIVLVHGGGAEVTDYAARLGITSEFADGVRMTGEEEMEVVDMVLAGLVNKRVARRFQRAGVRCAGICASDGGLLTGTPVFRPDGSASRTGRVVSRDPAFLEHVLDAGYLAVVASTFTDGDGGGLNLNADDAALEIAMLLAADALVFLSDVPGILRGRRTEDAGGAPRTGTEDEVELISRLTPTEAEAEIAVGAISGGMIPKVRSSVAALHAGVGIVIIGSYTEDASLRQILDGNSGTRIEQ